MIDMKGHLEQLERMRRQSRQRSGSLRLAAAQGKWDEFDKIAASGIEDGSDGDERPATEPGGDNSEGDGVA